MQLKDRVWSVNKKKANTIKWERDTRFCFQEKNGYECTGYYIFLYICPRFTSRVVDRLKEYKIAHRGLGEGVHTFEFVMDDGFLIVLTRQRYERKSKRESKYREVILADGGSDDDRRDS